MSRFLVAAVTALLASTAGRADTFVYVSVAGEKRFAIYLMDRATGKLTHRGDAKLDGEPGALTVDPARQFLFAALRAEGKLTSLRMNPSTGMLTHLSTVPAGPDPAHLSTDAAGRDPLAAYYVDAKVTVHAIGKDGTLAEKPLQSLLTADKAHAIVSNPSGRFVFVSHTGPDVIFQFAFDAKTGKLSSNEPAKLSTPKGTGPRHLVFHPTKPIAYVANEQGGSVTAYALDPGAGTLKARPCLLGRSRGGLWVTSWAADNPDKVAGLAGIYPVFDLRSYPGLAKAAPAYGLTAKELEARLGEFNPIDRVGVLAKARVPALLIHGDEDKVVPLKENSAEFTARYKSAGAEGVVKLIVAKGQGHNYWEGFFRCQELIDFTILQALAGKEAKERG